MKRLAPRHKSTRKSNSVFAIEDKWHAESQGEFSSFYDAIKELQRRAKLPWDEDPNVAPCGSWKTCGRAYEIIEYKDGDGPKKEILRILILEVSSSGIKWH